MSCVLIVILSFIEALKRPTLTETIGKKLSDIFSFGSETSTLERSTRENSKKFNDYPKTTMVDLAEIRKQRVIDKMPSKLSDYQKFHHVLSRHGSNEEQTVYVMSPDPPKYLTLSKSI